MNAKEVMKEVGCQAPQNVTLKERLKKVNRVQFINHRFPGLIFSNVRVLEVGTTSIRLSIPPREGHIRPVEYEVSFKKPLMLLFPVPFKRITPIADVLVTIKGIKTSVYMDEDISEFEADLISLGKDFVEVIAAIKGFRGHHIIFIPLNRFTRITSLDDEE